MADELIGQTIGHYKISKQIGEGGMASVYQATQPSIGREVAIKILPPNFAKDKNFQERFEREVKVIAALQHPRILPVYDYGQYEDRPYIVMAHLTGGTLRDKIEASEEGLAFPEIIRYIEQISEALDFAHFRGIVHRDFKPENVLLDEEGNVHLADFGIAKIQAGTSRLTGTALVGTPSYMAPEMGDEGEITRLVDIYALGCTLFQMITGEVPFDATNPMGVLMAHLSQSVPDARKVRPEVPEDVQYVIEKAMAKLPSERYQTAKELVDELKLGFASKLGKSPGGTTRVTLQLEKPGAPSSRTRGRIPGWAYAAGGAVIALIAAIIIFGVPSGGGDPTTRGKGDAGEAPVIVAVDEDTPTPTSSPEPTATETPEPTETPTVTPTLEPTPLGGGSGMIAFESFRSGLGQIFLMNVENLSVSQLTDDPFNNTFPRWSPDGTKIVFVSGRNSNQDIFIMDADGSNLVQLTTNVNDDTSPMWSPDGRKILFVSNRDRDYNIYSMNADGTGQLRLTENPSDDRAPVWSPDGTKIAFHAFVESDNEIFIMNADGSDVVQITDNDGQDEDPIWSPDGNQILFSSTRDGDYEIYVMDADGENAIQLTMNTVSDISPVWSADGNWIVFVSERDANRELYLMRANGQSQTRLTEDISSDGSPSWGPMLP